MNVNRIALGIRYDGTAYHGWQTQDNLPTVQQRLELALSRVADHPISLTCAGRTDAGVHACAQVVHFDTDAVRSDHSWLFGANSNLPPDIRVIWAQSMPHDFHARYSATGRTYRYVLFNNEIRPGILRYAVGWYYKPLDADKMQEAANYLIGEHDFSAYRGADCQSKTTHRNMYELTVRRQRRMVIIEAHANAFLLHMVRNIAGVLIEVGNGSHAPQWAKEVLESRDRCQGGVTISPYGLYLVKVDYPEQFVLPEMPIGPFFLP